MGKYRRILGTFALNILVILSILIPLCLPTPVQAATAILTVTGESGYSTGGSISYVGLAANYTNLNSDDADTSYCRFYPGDSFIESAWTVSTLTGVTSINSVTIYYKASLSGTDRFRYSFVRIAGINYYSDASTVVPDAGYYLYSYTWAVNPATGVAWTQSDVNSSYYGLRLNGIGATDYHITWLYGSVDYVAAVPTISTVAASTPTYTGGSHNATLNGNISSAGGSPVTQRGFVWSATSNSTSPGNIVPPVNYTSNWTEGSSSWGIGAFTHNVGGLTKGATYYFRAYANNIYGWAWGDELSFTALTDPSITTAAATLISTTTARMNANLVNSGGVSCSVRFLRGTVTGVYTSNTTAIAGYTTGQSPYADLAGLTIGTTYFYRVEATNSVSTVLGSEVSFTTSTGVNEPTNLQGIPSSNAISLLWIRGAGSTNTYIVAKTGGYPTSKTDGTVVYNSTSNSYKYSGLTSGITYYFMAWGESGGYYSTSNVTLMATTSASTASSSDLPDPITPDSWFQSPDYTNMSSAPFYAIFNFAFECFDLPKSTGWYMCALVFSVAVGIFFYSSLGNQNLFLSVMAVGVSMVIMSMLKLVPLWNILPFAIIAVTGIFVGERRG
jgi:hypothetical protein